MHTLALVSNSASVPSMATLLILSPPFLTLYIFVLLAKNTTLEVENRALAKRVHNLEQLAGEDAITIAHLEKTSDLAIAKAAEQIGARLRAEAEANRFRQEASFQPRMLPEVRNNARIVEEIAEGPSGLIH